ncbi:MAG: hypothetical protein KGI26_04850 [Thaumarchaeota archaeon]|nr:hypothetical protein [Nitrososphaerota archaeon]
MPITVKAGTSALANAQVTLVQFNGTATGLSPTLTGSNGVASIPFEGKGSYQVSAAKFGYVNQTATQWLTSANSTAFPVFNLLANTVPVTINAISTPFAIASPVAYLDGVRTALPTTVEWIIGSQHNVTAPSPVLYGAGNSSVWAFGAWSGGASGTNRKLAYSVTGSATLTENYGLQEALTVQSNSTRGLVSPTTEYLAYGASVSVSASPSAGWLFANWTLDSAFVSTVNPISLTMTQPHTLLAQFKPASTTIAFQVTGPSSLTATVDGKADSLPASFNWLPGSTHKVSFPDFISTGAGAGWNLTEISLAGSSLPLSNLTITVPNSPATYALTFTKYYQLNVQSTDSRAVKPSVSWYLSGSTVTLTAPRNLTLSDGSILVLKSYTLDGVAGTGLPLQIPMTAPHAVSWTYLLEYPLSVSGRGNDGQSLGTGAYFIITPPSGPTFQMTNGNTTYLQGGTYGVALWYAGASVNSTTVRLLNPTQVVLTVHVGGTDGAFTFHVFGGTLVSANLQGNNTLSLSVAGAEGFVRIFVPPGAYYQDFFTVTGSFAASSFDQAQRLEIVNFTGPSTFTLQEPAGQVFILGSSQLVEALSGTAVVGEFSAFAVNSTLIGVNFQTLTAQQGVVEAKPFHAVTDPSGLYTITFGYFQNGIVPVAVNAISTQMTFKEAAQTLQYGQVLQTTAINAPTTNAASVPMQAATSATQSGCSGNAYEVDVLGQPFAAMCWVLGNGNLPAIYIFNLQNQYVTGGSVTTTGKVIVAVVGGTASGSVQTVAVAFGSYSYTAANVILTGTAPVTAKQLPSGKFGPVSVNFDPHSPTSASMVCTSGQCTEQASVMGAYDLVKVMWQALPQGAGFNVTVNGVPLIVNGDPSCAAARNLTASEQPGIDLNQCVQGSASQGSNGEGYFTFTPARAGQFQVCVSQQSFAGDYSGCQTAYATSNPTLTSAGTGIAFLAVIGGIVVYARKHHRPRPTIRAQGR